MILNRRDFLGLTATTYVAAGFPQIVMGAQDSTIKSTINYDETRVPAYNLPNPLVLTDGNRINDADTWQTHQRPQILKLFEDHVYGASPGRTEHMRFIVKSSSDCALNGKAIRKQVIVNLETKTESRQMEVLIHLPSAAKKPAPTFVGLNFFGNHSIHPDPGITLSKQWMRDRPEYGVIEHRATQASRGVRAHRWPVEDIIARGYALATVYYGDIDPDFDDGFQNGVHPLFYRKGQSAPAANEWGAIAAWSWGLSRVMDYLETDASIDHKRVAVIGHSRLGKAALWAGAQDQRFALVVSNNSGCGGAALSRRRFGETVKRVNDKFPHWFCGNFKTYNDNEAVLPVDQHMLIALIAPRPVYIASATEDLWADPKGEFLSAKHASPVYKLLGKDGFAAIEMPRRIVQLLVQSGII